MNSGSTLSIVAVLSLGSLGLATFGQTGQPPVPSSAKTAQSGRSQVDYGKLPLSFEPNLGQTAKEVQWLARGPEYTLYLAGPDAVLEMNEIVQAKRGATSREEMAPRISSSVVRMNLIGTGTSQQTAGEDLQSGKANYFTGNDPAKWQHDVPMYGKVRLKRVYPGIDLVYYGRQGQLEYDFVVAPGADASAIRMNFDGAEAEIASDGDLRLSVTGASTEVRFNRPVVYQMKDGVRQPIDASFVIAEDHRVSFKLGAYDRSRELVIDPTFDFVGALGTGNYETQASGMAVDASGEIILTGATSDVDFPVTSGAYQTTCNQDSAVAAANNYVRCGGASEGYLGSAFITKISADGTTLVYSTYLHGFSGSEAGQAVAIDAAGDAVVLGQTGSYDFPITSDAVQSLCMPYYQPIGVAGGSPSDFYPIGQHCDGYYAGGGTEWVSGGPTLFISKLDPTGSTLIYSTFFGGTNPTYPSDLALDSSGNIYFTSFLQGAEEYLQDGVPVENWYPQNGTVPFPYTSSAFEIASPAQQVATLSVLSADGQSLLYSTLFGAAYSVPGLAFVQPLTLAVGPNGIAYVGGVTSSDAVPTTAGSVRPACVDSSVYNGNNETGNCEGYTGWLAAFDTTQSGNASLKYATYIGGPEIEGGTVNGVWGLAADSSNNVYVTGMTISPTYPTTAGAYSSACTNYRPTTGYCNNSAFLTKINPAGSAYVWSTYYTGNNDSTSQGQAIGFDAKGRVYLYGYDSNYTYDLPFLNPLEPRPGNGSSYAFLATFTPDGTKLLFATPLGNQSSSAGNVFPVPNNGMAVDADGNIYFAAYGADSGTWNTTTATPGTYATTALGGSNRTFFGKISPVTDPTATTLTISPSTSISGQTVTFTASVVGTAVTTPTLTGTVTLVNSSADPATTLGTITLGSSGSGKFTTSSLPVGSYSVTANYSGDSNYFSSTSNPQTLVVNPRASQTITFATIPSQTIGTLLTLSASASSGLPVTYSTITGSRCTISGTTATFIASGTCTIYAGQAGNADYSAAPEVSQSFTVNKEAQTISFATIPAQAIGTPLTLSATASSGLAATFASLTGSRCTVSGTTATFIATGTCSIQATQTGNSTYAAAPTVTQSFTINREAQTITFAAIPSQVIGTPLTLSATASSGLTVTFQSITGSRCTVTGTTATFTETGTCIIEAIQTGNSIYSAAPVVSQSFTVNKETQSITFPTIPAQAVGTPLALSATASSGLTVTFSSLTGSRCTVSGTTATYIATGTCTIVAAQTGNSTYAAAPTVSQSFTINKGAQTITFPTIPAQTVGTPLTLSATASSGLAVTFSSITGSRCTISGSTATFIEAGTCTIYAVQTGSVNYSAAPEVSQSFTVNPN